MKWIPTAERMPKHGEIVLGYQPEHAEDPPGYAIVHGRYSDRRNTLEVPGDSFSMDTVTHWMPFPDPPGEATT